MSEESINQILAEYPFVIGYMCVLLMGSILSIAYLARARVIEKRIHVVKLKEWKLPAADFWLFILALLVWMLIAGPLFMKGHELIMGKETSLGNGAFVLGGVFLQLGMVFVFLFFRQKFLATDSGPLSPRNLNFTQSAVIGLMAFLSSLPIILITNAIWTGLLEWLKSIGIEFELPLQDAVLLFMESDSILHILSFALLAVIVAPIVEEAVFRAGIFRYLKGQLALPFSVLISSTLFAMVHGNIQSFPGLVAVGACLAITYEKTADIKVAMWFHAFFNLNSLVLMSILPDSLR